MGSGAEFDAIRALLDVWGDLAVGIGDDAAVLTFGNADGASGASHASSSASLHAPTFHVVVSTDSCVEDVHFRREWITPHDVGVRATTAALSDLAAMGAHATAVLVSFVVPGHWQRHLVDVARGIGHVVRNAQASIVGGNIARGDRFSITTTAIGTAAHPVKRSGAQPGDLLLITGALGGPATAVAALGQGLTPDAWAMARFTSPAPRLAEGQQFARLGVHAMIDVSDGLLADAGHLARASRVDVVIDTPKVPCGPGVTTDLALAGGEEYELLATAPPDVAWRLSDASGTDRWTQVTIIGEVRAAAAEGDVLVRDANDKKAARRVELSAGHDHFSA